MNKLEEMTRAQKRLALAKKIAARRRAQASTSPLLDSAQRKPVPKPDTSSTSRMLTPSEIADLRQKGKEADAYLRKVFKNIQPE